MKSFILLVLMTDFNNAEYLDQVNNIVYTDKLSCLADKACHSKESVLASDAPEVKSIQYFCADSLLYKKKGNKQHIFKEEIVYYNAGNKTFYGK